MTTSEDIRRELAALGDVTIASHSQRFFKTGPGEYGEGDRFRGIRVPVLRKLARKHRAVVVDEIERLLQSEYHEDRLAATLMLVQRFERGDETQRARIYELYLRSTDRINNWDLVDSSAHLIVGPWLADRPRDELTQLARSASLWERRIAIIATLAYIKQRDYTTTLEIADALLDDPEDLIHKAVGWMLREVGDRDRDAEERFLRDRYARMPRTMLRYAIEKFPEDLRQAYLRGNV